MSEQQSTITKKTKGEGFKWGQELLKAKAIISDQQAEIDVLEGDVSALTKIIADLEETIEKLKTFIACSGVPLTPEIAELVFEKDDE